MTKQRLSKLQKAILTTLFKTGGKVAYKLSKFVDKNDKEKITELEGKGYKFANKMFQNNTNIPSGELRYEIELPDYKLRRQKLIFEVHRWQEYNRYSDECAHAGLNWVAKSQNKVPSYRKKQAAFTRSLQTLAAHDLIELLGGLLNGKVAVYGSIFAKKLGIKPQNFKREHKKALSRIRRKWQEEKKINPKIGTFNQWFKRPFTQSFMGIPTGGKTTQEKLFRSWHTHRLGRNIREIRLTPKGVSKAEECLKLNLVTRLP